MQRIFTVDETQHIPLGLFVHGEPYKLLGFIESDLHLFGPIDTAQPVYLFGADRQ